ncbi:MAG: twin-arginine translocation signal domain-containing protein [Myxococcales bacterium]|nr:twin-arginine translocation signal domain-containing protein [Myxococcales bacterium]
MDSSRGSTITRRAALAAVACAGVAGGVGAVTALRWWDRAPGEALVWLSADEHDFVQAVAEAWMPRGGTPSLSGADAQLGSFVDGVLEGMAPSAARETKLLLQALDDLPVVTRLRPYRRLPLHSRAEVLQGWLQSSLWPLRTGATALMMLIGLGWTTHPEVASIFQPHFGCGYGR